MRLHPKFEFNPTIEIPEGFYLIQDTREQQWRAKELFGKPQPWLINSCLKVGDFSIKGMETIIGIERKTLGDFLSCMGSDRERFTKNQVKPLLKFRWKGLLIEATEEDVLYPPDFGGTTPNQVYHSLSSLELRGFHIYYAKSRDRARQWVLSRLTRWYKYMREGKL